MTDTATLVSRIGATWFGSGLSEGSVERLAGMAREYETPARARLLREGDETRELSVLVDGRVALTEHVAGRGSVTLMTVEPGDVFGWSALIAPYKATSTVVSLEPVKVIAFDGASLRESRPLRLRAGMRPSIPGFSRRWHAAWCHAATAAGPLRVGAAGALVGRRTRSGARAMQQGGNLAVIDLTTSAWLPRAGPGPTHRAAARRRPDGHRAHGRAMRPSSTTRSNRSPTCPTA